MRKVQLTIKQEEVAPATTSDLVVMSHGKTLKEELSANVLDKFSREVTVVSSMEKVADGVYDGPYESLVFKGKSLVNLLTGLRPDTHSAWVRNGSSFTLNASGVLFLNYAALLKPNTTYTVVGELDFDVDGIVIGFREGNKSWEVNRSIGSRGRFAVLISTSAESTSNALTVHRAVTSNSDRVTLSNLMVLEGDWTNTELPHYFEGLGSCKMPILRNVGKNLFKTFKNEGYYEYNGSAGSNGQWVTDVKFKCLSSKILPNTEYIQSSKGFYSGNVLTFWKDGKFTGEGIRGKITTFTTPSNCDEIRVSCATENDLQLELGRSATAYEDHKTNILRTPETVTLRSLPNGVRDELNLKTGEYIKRIGEVVLDGSNDEGWGIDGYAQNNQVTNFISKVINDAKVIDNVVNYINNKTLSIPNNLWYGDDEGLLFMSNKQLAIKMKKTVVSTLEEFKQYLQQNPITVQYELAEPITTIVEPLTIPFAYENGHIILESGSEEQSLLPELKYSVPASKNGVLSTTSQAILKHEQRLHKLENLLLREAILMDYRLALSFLDKM